ncbi:hypothetical protein LINPERPRIM_LOCUS14378 [Linum perenne]
MNKTLLFLLVLLTFSTVKLSLAVPATRSNFMDGSSTKRNPSYSLPTRTHVLKGRRMMDIEQIMDYPDTGANDRHDPKIPGRN